MSATGTNQRNRQLPGVMGTITNGDTTTGQLLVQSQQSGTNVVIQVTNNTQIITQVSVTVADLQVNDQVMLPDMGRGGNMPPPQQGGSNTNASGFNGQRPAPPQDNGFNRRGNGTASSNAANNSQNGNRPNGNGGGRTPTVGRVTSFNPLTIASDSGDSVTLKLPTDARVMKLLSLTFNDLKIGDRVMAMGQNGSNGTFTAMQIAINMDIGQNGRFGNGQNSQQNNTIQGGQGQRGRGVPGVGGQQGQGRGRPGRNNG